MPLLDLAETTVRFLARTRGIRARFLPTRWGRVNVYQADPPNPTELRGDAPCPIVVVHGIGSNATAFMGLLLQLLDAGHPIVAPDLPGHGRSPAASRALDVDSAYLALQAVLDELLEQPALVFGNSLGGALACQYAIARPRHVRALALCSPAGAPMTDEELAALRSVFDVADRDAAIAFLQRLYVAPPWYLRALAGDVQRVLGSHSVRELLAQLSPARSLRPEELATLAMPTLLLWGDGDRILPRSGYRFFCEHLPAGARLEQVHGWGHCPQLEQVGALASRLLRFARSLAVLPAQADVGALARSA